MLKTLIRLSDGTEISSGVDADMNIRSCTITQCVNSGTELTLGSVCAACAELVLQVPDGILKEEDAFSLFKVDYFGKETKIGIFNVKTSEQKGEQLRRITAYDNIIKLDVDITAWLSGWFESSPYSDVFTIVDAICNKLHLRIGSFPDNLDAHAYQIYSFTPERVNCRQFFRWVAEMLACFCVADSDGNICFRWYRDNTQIVLGKTGEWYRLQGAYKLHNRMLPFDGVQILRSSHSYVQSPVAYEYQSSYLIEDNPVLTAKDIRDVLVVSDDIIAKLNKDTNLLSGNDSFVACEVSVPASLDVMAGDIIVVDQQNSDDGTLVRLLMRVMTKVQSGQKDTLKCTGSYRRPYVEVTLGSS